ncbi:MAG: DEAD/DEAH box helicase [Desulfobulbus sp.]|nr:DEAD/DEAH box helicase [Desulfobulbus sp.]
MSFTQFQLNEHLTNSIKQCGFTTPTPIQQQAIPSILAGHDLLGLAQTGTGKTAAFILPALQRLMAVPSTHIRMLILAPTRELAEQINDFTRTMLDRSALRSLAIYGGVSKSVQVGQIRRGVDIVIACPGRLLDIINDRAIDLSHVEVLVLDEADHMFDKGFLPDIRRILSRIPAKRQNLVFSATMPDAIRHLAEKILVNPVKVQINPSRSAKSISHRLFTIGQEQKTDLLMHLLGDQAMTTTLVFTRTKHKAKNLALKLSKSGFKATSLQGNLSQNKRQEALNGFKNGSFSILVATDIAARGIDVTGISHVINYDMPDTAEAYIHRTGRTGRAACSGEALTFATSTDKHMIQLIERSLEGPMNRQTVPEISGLSSRNESRQQPVSTKPVTAPQKKSQSKTQAFPVPRKRRQRSPGSDVFGLSKRDK